MKTKKAPAIGDRIDFGGKKPQLDAFAEFVYQAILSGNLDWLKAGDIDAATLDDIQYSTRGEIHAYQVKWSNKEAPTPFSFANFLSQLLDMVEGWQKLKSVAATERKNLKIHLLTNRPASQRDAIKNRAKTIGSFKEFYFDAWVKLKSNKTVPVKWRPIIGEIKRKTKLSNHEFSEFIDAFELNLEFILNDFRSSNVGIHKRGEDLVVLSRFLLEQLSEKTPIIRFTLNELLHRLPAWEGRFKTIFNHELLIDKRRYQPIVQTSADLSNKILELAGGYIFLMGGPGSGKSTLLTEWSQKQSGNIIRYYAFDFTNPSSAFNYSERGESISLFYDLVMQIDQRIGRTQSTLIHKDLPFLKETFTSQLHRLGDKYSKTGEKTLIIIDGLDHIPREYKNASKNFLRDLPHPESIPVGVYIILGSQSFMLDDLSEEIKSKWASGERSIHIVGLDKKAVRKYVTSCGVRLTPIQNESLFESTNGHPLYLSYLVAKMLATGELDKILNEAITIDGNIDVYYRKIWEPIRSLDGVRELLSLIARINGNINPEFVKEWSISKSTQIAFKKSAKYLFDESGKSWSFFHNSFRLFIINDSSTNDVTGTFDFSLEKEFHIKLSQFYESSKVEREWKRIYHLYRAKDYEAFLKVATPEHFSQQFVQFRPYTEIRRDIELGIRIANERKSSALLVKYLFALAELDKRIFNGSANSFVEELIRLEFINDAKNNLRAGNVLISDEVTAFKAAILLYDKGDKTESNVLFSLAEPEFISESGITIESEEHSYYRSESLFKEWCNAALLFYDVDKLLSIIKHTKFSDKVQIPGSATELRSQLLFNCGEGLAKLQRWDDYRKVLQKLKGQRNYFLYAVGTGIKECLAANNISLANELLDDLLVLVNKKDKNKNLRLYIAELIYSVRQDIKLTKEWIDGISQPKTVENWEMSDRGLTPFGPRIRLNRLLNLCGITVSAVDAVSLPSDQPDERILAEFERMLCQITRLEVDCLKKKNLYEPIEIRIKPVIEFYYQEFHHRNKYTYNLNRVKQDYYEFLINAVSRLDADKFLKVAHYFLMEFNRLRKYWSPEIQRAIILAFIDRGLDPKHFTNQLDHIESVMLQGRDVSGRIDECYQHARAWRKVGNRKKALQLIESALKETLGVGYRKDYQFNTWLTWLRKINEFNPIGAEARITWFLSMIEHIKEVTEGDAFSDAADVILETTLQWNLAAGLKQMKWQLGRGLASFQDSINIFIRTSLNSAESIQEFEGLLLLYNDLFLFFSTSAQTTLLKEILLKGYHLSNDEYFTKILSRLITAIKINALEETRGRLLKVVDSFAKSHSIVIEEFYPAFAIPTPFRSDSRNNQPSSSPLLLSNRESLDVNEVKARSKEYAQLKSLMEHEDAGNSYFKWEDVFTDLPYILTIEQIIELSNVKRLAHRGSDFYTILSNCAFKIGANEIAEDFARKAISASSPSGWMKPYDGGTKVAAFKALQNVNKEKGTKEAFEAFCEDVLNTTYVGAYIEHLDQILPILDESWNLEIVWKELAEYIRKLIPDSEIITDLPNLSTEKRPVAAVQIELLIYLAKSPVLLIKEKAEQLLALMVKRDISLQNEIRFLATGVDDEMEIFINVMMNINLLSTETLRGFSAEILQLATSPNYLFRKYSRQLLNQINIPLPTISKIDTDKLYEFKMPSFKRGNDRGKNVEYEIVKKPYSLVDPYSLWLGLLEKATGVSKDIFYYRWVQIMYKLENEKLWDTEYENQLRFVLSETGLKYGFVRPQTKIAFRALCCLLAELVDGKMVPQEEIDYIFRNHDFESALINETNKPAFIQSLKPHGTRISTSDWFEFKDCERLNASFLSEDEGAWVIGEYTLVRSLDWGRPLETYMSQICVSENSRRDYIFGSAFEVMTGEYYQKIDLEPNIIIVREHRFNQFDIKSNWLAINPSLAYFLNWVPDESELLGWMDETGEKMVHSKFWRNGNIHMSPPHFESEAGCGWLVLASDKALEQIRSAVPALLIQKCVIRSKYEDGKEIEREVEAIFPF